MAGTDCHLEVWRSGCWNMESCPGCSLPHLPPPTSCCLALITPLSLSLGSCEHYRDISLVHSTSGYLVTSTSQVSQVSLLAGPRHAGDWRCGRGAAAADQLPCGEAPCREYPPWTGRRAAAARHTHTHSHEAGTLHPRPEHFSYKQECFKCRGKACKTNQNEHKMVKFDQVHGKTSYFDL